MFKILAVLAALFCAVPSYAQQSVAALTNPLPSDKVLGKASAPVTLIEYASLSCSHCANFHNDVLPTIQKEYIDTGKVRLIFRDFPLNAPALIGAQAAHCIGKADSAKYYQTIKTLFAKQRDWALDERFKPKLAALVKPMGMDAKAFDACLADKDIETKVLQSRQNGDKAGVASTPTFFVNGEKAEIHSVAEARKVIATALSGKSLAQQAKETAAKLMQPQPDDMVLGKASAKVTVIEYVNIACPHCAEFHQTLVTTLQKDYINTGKVRLVFRELPLSPSSFYAYMVAHCKGKEGFFAALNQLGKDAAIWGPAPAFITPLRASAQKMGIDKDAFYACIEDKDAAARITKHSDEAREVLKINHSPEMFINGKMVHAQTAEAIRQAVDAALAGK